MKRFPLRNLGLSGNYISLISHRFLILKKIFSTKNGPTRLVTIRPRGSAWSTLNLDILKRGKQVRDRKRSRKIKVWIGNLIRKTTDYTSGKRLSRKEEVQSEVAQTECREDTGRLSFKIKESWIWRKLINPGWESHDLTSWVMILLAELKILRSTKVVIETIKTRLQNCI